MVRVFAGYEVAAARAKGFEWSARASDVVQIEVSYAFASSARHLDVVREPLLLPHVVDRVRLDEFAVSVAIRTGDEVAWPDPVGECGAGCRVHTTCLSSGKSVGEPFRP